MKKILILLVMLFTLSLVGCNEQTTYDYTPDIQNVETDLQAQINDLELQIELLQQRIDSIVAVEGLNGNVVYYEKALQELSEELNEAISTFDNTKAPTYIVDENGDYVDFETVVRDLLNKYMVTATYRTLNLRTNSGQITIQYLFTDPDIEMVIAQTLLLIEEMRLYEYYIISYTKLTFEFLVSDGTHTTNLTIVLPLATMLNDMFTVNIDSIMGSLYEIDFSVSKVYDKAKVVQYYNDYKTAKSYDGYILNLE